MATCMTFQQISSFLHLILQIASKIRAAGTKKKKKFKNYPRGQGWEEKLHLPCAPHSFWRARFTLPNSLHRKYLKLTFIFNNCSPKAERILLNNRLGDYSTIFTESEANSCFSMISRVLSYSVVNSVL